MKKHLEYLIQKQTEGCLNLSEQIELSEQLADSKNQEAEEIFSNDWKNRLESEVPSG